MATRFITSPTTISPHRNIEQTEVTASFFHVGGNLSADAPSYVRRRADSLLLSTLQNHEVALVLAPRQSGKSSLAIRAIDALQQSGTRAILIDFQKLGKEDDRNRFFYTVAWLISDSVSLQTDFDAWWNEHAALSPPVLWTTFIEKILLPETEGDIVFFFDEIDSILRLPFSDEIFTTLRSLYNARAQNPALNRLTFALVGTASPAQFVLDTNRTPFNIGVEIPIEDFDSSEVDPFRQVLGTRADVLMERIFHWTGGQPLLVQRLAKFVWELPVNQRTTGRLDAHIEEMYLKRQMESDTHLKFIRDYLLEAGEGYDTAEIRKTLQLYADVLARKRIEENRQSPTQTRLRLAGVIKVQNGLIVSRCTLYEQIFTAEWAERNMPEADTPLERWLAAGKSEDFLLRGSAIQDEINRQWEKKIFSEESKEFIAASKVLQKRDSEKEGGRILGVGCVWLVALVASVVSWLVYHLPGAEIALMVVLATALLTFVYVAFAPKK